MQLSRHSLAARRGCGASSSTSAAVKDLKILPCTPFARLEVCFSGFVLFVGSLVRWFVGWWVGLFVCLFEFEMYVACAFFVSGACGYGGDRGDAGDCRHTGEGHHAGIDFFRGAGGVGGRRKFWKLCAFCMLNFLFPLGEI